MNKVLEALVGIALMAMTLSVAIQILVRFVFTKFDINLSVPWTEELARYLMVWALFIGAAIIARRADSLAVEALVNLVPSRIGRIIKAAALLITLVFYGYIIVVGLEVAEFGLTETSMAMGVPMVFVYSSMSIGAVLTIINLIAFMLDIYINKKDILHVIDEEITDDQLN
ncbi:TRAP transporter small permease [Ammoniphilus sp. YIM 78166]|uniref:TRAP transporter small permease n=1 Tax=Ammoniphilus sp. YIM 78166 TaxID=1644106 RepID=UPI001431DD79|nr:TRAP transporter small permease [Ammoniphilus sp. YIM 78166]